MMVEDCAIFRFTAMRKFLPKIHTCNMYQFKLEHLIIFSVLLTLNENKTTTVLPSS